MSLLILVPVFLNWANTPNYSVAFSGLSEADAGQIVEKLAEQGVPYQLRSSGAVMVPSDQVYEVRLRMAREGLPEGGNVGFELFSGNMLGMTEFTQRVNYQRALEGELERTISSLAPVSAVRVHIVTPEKTLLREEQAQTTASITIQEKPGAHLDASSVNSITHLVASSVEGLSPENVVVVDVNGNMLASGAGESGVYASAGNDSQRAAELAAAADMQSKVQSLLDSALGPNRSVVQASVAMDWTQREVTQQSFDPNTTTIRSSQLVTETYIGSEGAAGGIPGAGSNLPDQVNTTIVGDQQNEYRRSEETTNYEITQTETREIKAPGEIERVTLSVLVDGVQDAAHLDTLKAVIAAAAGIDESRGDMLAVQSLAFDRSFFEEQTAEMEENQQTDFYWKVGQAAAAVLLLIALLWYTQRLLSRLRLASSEAWAPVLKPVTDMSLPKPDKNAEQIKEEQMRVPPALPTIAETMVQIPTLSEEDEKLQRLVVRLAEENPATVAEIIQMWLGEDEK